MPLYEYRCPGCHEKFELFRPVRQASEDATCPRCQSSARRILSTFCSISRDEHGLTPAYTSNSCSSCNSGNCSS
ncbi:MAG: zinc ribbon domain-containing protein [Chloroflexota bacterium]